MHSGSGREKLSECEFRRAGGENNAPLDMGPRKTGVLRGQAVRNAVPLRRRPLSQFLVTFVW